MGKYDALRDALHRRRPAAVTLTFGQIDEIVPGGLPSSAFRYQAWWSNETSGSHVQALSWQVGGYRVVQVDLAARTVTFAAEGVADR